MAIKKSGGGGAEFSGRTLGPREDGGESLAHLNDKDLLAERLMQEPRNHSSDTDEKAYAIHQLSEKFRAENAVVPPELAGFVNDWEKKNPEIAHQQASQKYFADVEASGGYVVGSRNKEMTAERYLAMGGDPAMAGNYPHQEHAEQRMVSTSPQHHDASHADHRTTSNDHSVGVLSEKQISKADDYLKALSPEARVEAAHSLDEGLKHAKNSHLHEMAGNAEKIAILQNKILDGSITPKEEAQMDGLIARSEKSMTLARQDPGALKEFADIGRSTNDPTIKNAVASIEGNGEQSAKVEPEKGVLEKVVGFVMHPIDNIKEMVGFGEEKHAHTAKSETAIEAPKIAQTSNEPPKSALMQQAEALRNLGKLLERPDIKESIASAVQFNDKQAIAQNGHQNHTGESLGGLNGGAGLKGQSEARSV